MPQIDKILTRLDKVRPHGDSKWMACCPAHPDKTPSLSITERSDGVVLLHCFSACETEDVVAAIGLELSDLFPDDMAPPSMPYGKRKKLIDALAHERYVVAIYRADCERLEPGQTPNEADAARADIAKRRIATIRSMLDE